MVRESSGILLLLSVLLLIASLYSLDKYEKWSFVILSIFICLVIFMLNLTFN